MCLCVCALWFNRCITGLKIKIHCRHCVSAVSPPGTTLPNDTEIPHVAGMPGVDDGGLPPGERCYSCDVGKAGIPLERRLSNQRGRRYRRHVDPLPVAPNAVMFLPFSAWRRLSDWRRLQRSCQKSDLGVGRREGKIRKGRCYIPYLRDIFMWNLKRNRSAIVETAESWWAISRRRRK